MGKKAVIYLRGLKHVNYSVFCVDSNGQKVYYDPQYNKYLPFSSGQQVKRCNKESLLKSLNVNPSPTTFFFELDSKGALNEKEVVSTCNPEYIDQLLFGYMNLQSCGESEEDRKQAFKRRSPLRISAMTPLHPLLAAINKEDISIDGSDRPHVHKVVVRGPKGNVLTDDEVKDCFERAGRSPFKHYLPKDKNGARATGFFVYNAEIDLRMLFCVGINNKESEISQEKIESLKNKGWKVIENVFGECLLMPKEDRERIIPEIAEALIEWEISSNQSRTYDPMETLSIAISDNAQKLSSCITAKRTNDDDDNPKVKPIVKKQDGAEVFITRPCAGYMYTEDETDDALDNAKKELIKRMMEFDYENQLETK